MYPVFIVLLYSMIGLKTDADTYYWIALIAFVVLILSNKR